MIAVVDDDEAVLETTAILLESYGFNLRCFCSAQAFLHAVSGGDFTHLLTDIDMPDMTGIELLAHIRPLNLHLITIVVTALADSAVVEQAMSGGAIAVLKKPVLISQLLPLLAGDARF